MDGLEPDGSGPSATEPGDDPSGLVGLHRETCEDNPLLAECLSDDSCLGNTPSSACSSAPEPGLSAEDVPAEDLPAEDPTEEELLLLAAARNVLLSSCGPCHGSALTRAQAADSINFIDDWSGLVRAGYIERCAPERSRVVVLMRTGVMPPRSSGMPRVSDADIAVVEEAIDLDCQ